MARSYKKIDYDGIKFDSESELEFYKMLKIAKAKGNIKDFKCSPHYVLQEGDWSNWRGDKQDTIDHYPDFLITDNEGNQFIVDTKGAGVSNHEADAKLKKLIFEYLNREIPYYYISELPKFLGGEWVESSPKHDFYSKLKSKYKKLFPNENVRDWRNCKKFLHHEWTVYYDYENKCGLFYIMNKQYTQKELDKIEKDKIKMSK